MSGYIINNTEQVKEAFAAVVQFVKAFRISYYEGRVIGAKRTQHEITRIK